MNKSIVLLFSLALPFFVFAQQAQTNPAPFAPRYANTLPKPVLIRGPYLQVATSNSMVIRWRTESLSRSRVRYGTEAGKLDMFSDDSTLVTEHKVKLSNLMPKTKYYYSIGSLFDTLQGDKENYFVTLPVQGEEGVYRIGVFGDCGTNSVLQRNVKNEFLKYLGNNYLDAWILLGDNAYENGTDAQYQPNFFNVYKNDLLKKYPMFPAPGNHDYGNVDFSVTAVPQRNYDIAYYQIFSMPVNGEAGGVASNKQAYYSFDIGNIHFLSLDSYGKEEGVYRLYDTLSAQVQWVKKDLEANKNKGWVVAYWHHPPYSMGSHNSDNQLELVKIRENFIRILERYGVDLVLCGHSHLYERSKLMQGHYGMENTFDAAKYNVSNSTGLYDGTNNSCPYVKKSNNGIVYVVTGSAGKISETQPTYPHDAMTYSNAQNGGASMIEVNGNRLDFKWICDDGIIRDHFTMMKNVNNKTVVNAKKGDTITLTASFAGDYKWSPGKQTTKSITVNPSAGKSIYTVRDSQNCLVETFEVKTSK